MTETPDAPEPEHVPSLTFATKVGRVPHFAALFNLDQQTERMTGRDHIAMAEAYRKFAAGEASRFVENQADRCVQFANMHCQLAIAKAAEASRP